MSIAEGRQLFGNVGVTSSDPNLRVALNECRVTPTNRVDDPNSHIVIKNGLVIYLFTFACLFIM